MKYLLLLILMVASKTLTAQGLFMETVPAKDGMVYYESITEAPGLTKDLLYERIKKWASLNIRKSKSTIDYENKEEGEIIFKFLIPMQYDQGFPLTICDVNLIPVTHFYVKDGKYKVTISSFSISCPATCTSCGDAFKNYSLEEWCALRKNNRRKFLQSLNPEMIKLMDNMKKEILATTEASDW